MVGFIVWEGEGVGVGAEAWWWVERGSRVIESRCHCGNGVRCTMRKGMVMGSNRGEQFGSWGGSGRVWELRGAGDMGTLQQIQPIIHERPCVTSLHLSSSKFQLIKPPILFLYLFQLIRHQLLAPQIQVVKLILEPSSEAT